MIPDESIEDGWPDAYALDSFQMARESNLIPSMIPEVAVEMDLSPILLLPVPPEPPKPERDIIADTRMEMFRNISGKYLTKKKTAKICGVKKSVVKRWMLYPGDPQFELIPPECMERLRKADYDYDSLGLDR